MTYAEAMAKAERDYLHALLAATNDNVSEAAKLGQINRQHLHRLLARCGLRQPRKGRSRGGNAAWAALQHRDERPTQRHF